MKKESYDSSLEIYWSRKRFDRTCGSRIGNWSSFWKFDPKLEPKSFDG